MMGSMEDQVPARWEGINGGPFINANDLLAFMESMTFNSSNLTKSALATWISHMKGVRLDELAAVLEDADVPAMRKDLLALRDELEGD
jgi:hypothetical protein